MFGGEWGGGATNSGGGVDGDGDDKRYYSLEEIFFNESDMDDFKHVIGRKEILRMMVVS